MNNSIRLALLSAAMLFGSLSHATTVSFYCITNNDTTGSNCATGVAQLSVNVIDIGSGKVQFDFINNGPTASSIADVYFDDGALLDIASIINSTGVDFLQNATPGDLPSGNTANPSFEATQEFTADSNPPVQPNGVNPYETLGIVFNLQGGLSFTDVITDLTNGDLRIGLHVQGIGSGGSESFVNNPIPVPAAVWLFGSGLLGLVGLARRKRA